jgi:hypothetical protein
MIIIAILATLVGIAALCWLLFNLAVFALPLFAGIAIGPVAGGGYQTGQGLSPVRPSRPGVPHSRASPATFRSRSNLRLIDLQSAQRCHVRRQGT